VKVATFKDGRIKGRTAKLLLCGAAAAAIASTALGGTLATAAANPSRVAVVPTRDIVGKGLVNCAVATGEVGYSPASKAGGASPLTIKLTPADDAWCLGRVVTTAAAAPPTTTAATATPATTMPTLIPLAAPVFLGGLRLATIALIAIATLGGYAGAGGLGNEIFFGLQRQYIDETLAGSVPAAALAIVADALFRLAERRAMRRIGA